MNSSALRGYLLVAGMCVFWGASWPIMKIALTEIPPWTFRTISLTCGGIGLLMLAKLRGTRLTIPRAEFWPLVLVSIFNVTGWHLGSAHGISHMEAGRAVIVGFTMPLWATIFSSLVLKEKLTARRIAGLALGVTALYFIIHPQLVSIGGSPKGVAFMLIAALSWATGTVLLKYFQWSISTVLLTGWQLTLGSLPVIIGAFIFDTALKIGDLSSPAILSMGYVIIFPMLFCPTCFFH